MTEASADPHAATPRHPSRSRRKIRRVMVGPGEIAGYTTTLVRALRESGIKAEYVDLRPHRFGYSGEGSEALIVRLTRNGRQRVRDIPRVRAGRLWPVKIAELRRSDRRRREWMSLLRQSARRRFWVIESAILSWVLVLWALVRFDNFIFVGINSLDDLRELPLLRRARKHIVFVFQGSDARAPYINGPIVHRHPDGAELARRTRVKKERLRVVERFADEVVSFPTYSHLQERPFISAGLLGLTAPPDVSVDPRPPAKARLRILHAPSHPPTKGTDLIRTAIEALQGRGYKLEYVEIADRPNEEVLQHIASCDIVVDELFNDARTSALAAEAGWFGKPVVMAGYALEFLEEIGAWDSTPPLVYCEPERIASAIEELITDEAARSDLGQRAREFVEKEYDLRLLAERYSMILDGTAPPEWYYAPQRTTYVWGYGMSRERLVEAVRSIVAAAGPEALCLSDKPHLEKMFMTLIDAS